MVVQSKVKLLQVKHRWKDERPSILFNSFDNTSSCLQCQRHEWQTASEAEATSAGEAHRQASKGMEHFSVTGSGPADMAHWQYGGKWAPFSETVQETLTDAEDSMFPTCVGYINIYNQCFENKLKETIPCDANENKCSLGGSLSWTPTSLSSGQFLTATISVEKETQQTHLTWRTF